MANLLGQGLLQIGALNINGIVADPLDDAVNQAQAREQENEEKKIALIWDIALQMGQQLQALKGEKNQLAMERDLLQQQINDLEKKHAEEWKEHCAYVNTHVRTLFNQIEGLHEEMVRKLEDTQIDRDKRHESFYKEGKFLDVGKESGKYRFMSDRIVYVWDLKGLYIDYFLKIDSPEEIKKRVIKRKKSSPAQQLSNQVIQTSIVPGIESTSLLFSLVEPVKQRCQFLEREILTLRATNQTLEKKKEDLKSTHAEEIKTYRERIDEILKRAFRRVQDLRYSMANTEERERKSLEKRVCNCPIENCYSNLVSQGMALGTIEIVKIADQELALIEQHMQQFLKSFQYIL